ncbi:MAG: hypothetical protein VXZ99_15760 [Pseudomonadota bacterium]|nr:hypothetical protein [Pseudomonadota bacterium]
MRQNVDLLPRAFHLLLGFTETVLGLFVRADQIGNRFLHSIGIIVGQAAVVTELEIAALEFLLQAVRRPEQPDRQLVLAELTRIFARVDDFSIRLFQFAFVFLDKPFAAPAVRAAIRRRVNELPRALDNLLDALENDIRRERFRNEFVNPGVAGG